MGNIDYDNFKYFNIVEGERRGTNGQLLSYEADDGHTVYLEIINAPKIITSDTPLIFYYTGGGDYIERDFNNVYDGLAEYGGCNALIIAADIEDPKNNMRILEGVEKELGVPAKNYNSVSWSHGNSIALKTAVLLKAEHPEVDSGVLAFLDPNEMRLGNKISVNDTNVIFYNYLNDFKFLVFGEGRDGGNIKRFKSYIDLSLISRQGEIQKKFNLTYSNGWHVETCNLFFRTGGADYITGFSSKFNAIFNISLDDYFLQHKEKFKFYSVLKSLVNGYFDESIVWNNEIIKNELGKIIYALSVIDYDKISNIIDYSSSSYIPNVEEPIINKAYNEFDTLDVRFKNIIENIKYIDASVELLEKTEEEKAEELPSGGSITEGSSSPVYNKQDFPEYETIKNNEYRYVIEKDGYKQIIYHDGEKIIGIEDYYDVRNTDNINVEIDKISNKYINESNVSSLLVSSDNQDGVKVPKYIKVVYNEDYYSNMSIDNFNNNQ